MKINEELLKSAWKDYLSRGIISVVFLMRKYKASPQMANKVMEEINKRTKYNFNAKVGKV